MAAAVEANASGGDELRGVVRSQGSLRPPGAPRPRASGRRSPSSPVAAHEPVLAVAADEETVQRHRRLLSEQVYLLRNKVGNGIGFLRPKLVKNLDNQLKALVNARLKVGGGAALSMCGGGPRA
jgi:hypothetical protein